LIILRCYFNVHRKRLGQDNVVAPEDRTARLTVLIDPRKKMLFEQLCAEEDTTPSQVVRRLIRGYILERSGQPWVPSAEELQPSAVQRSAAPPGSRQRETPRARPPAPPLKALRRRRKDEKKPRTVGGA
jgi:Ribbon-helix-helix protein